MSEQRDKALKDALYGVIEIHAKQLAMHWYLSRLICNDQGIALKSAIQLHGKLLGDELTEELLQDADAWIDAKAEPSVAMWAG